MGDRPSPKAAGYARVYYTLQESPPGSPSAPSHVAVDSGDRGGNEPGGSSGARAAAGAVGPRRAIASSFQPKRREGGGDGGGGDGAGVGEGPTFYRGQEVKGLPPLQQEGISKSGDRTVFAIVTEYPARGASGQECDGQGFCAVTLSGCSPVQSQHETSSEADLLDTAHSISPSSVASGPPQRPPKTRVELLGYRPGPEGAVHLNWTFSDGRFKVLVPPRGAPGTANVTAWAFVLQLTGVE